MVDKESKFIPNSFQTPNVYIDKYLAILHPQESVVLIYTVRRIFGFHKEAERISRAEYENGRRKRNGDVMDNGTGVKGKLLTKVLSNLLEFGFIIQIEPATNKLGPLYTLQLDDSKINHDALQKRIDEQYQANLKRTQAASSALKLKRVGSSSDDTSGYSSDEPPSPSWDDTPRGSSDEPPSPSWDDTPRGSSDDTPLFNSLNTLERPLETHTENQRAGAREEGVCVSEKTVNRSEFSDDVIRSYANAHDSIKVKAAWIKEQKESALWDKDIELWLLEEDKKLQAKQSENGNGAAEPKPELMNFTTAATYVNSVGQHIRTNEELADYIATLNVSDEDREKLKEKFLKKEETTPNV